MKPRLPQEIQQLIHEALHGKLTDTQRQTLSDWITASGDNARAYTRLVMDDLAIASELEQGSAHSARTTVDESRSDQDDSAYAMVLAELAQAEADADAELAHPFDMMKKPKKAPAERPSLKEVGQVLWYLGSRPKVWGPVAAVLALAAAVTLVVIFAGGADNKPSDKQTAQQPEAPANAPAAVATLTGSNKAQWSGTAPTLGDALHSGQRLTLTAGFAEITTNRGAVAILEAPATIELLDNNNAIRLHTGKLVGLCHTQASKGFVVKTDHADITDHGTEFGVQVTGRGLTTTVFTGEVHVRVPGGQRHRLTANQTARRANTGTNRELVIEQRLAAGFDLLRSRPTITQVQCPTSGAGLAVGEVDPNWQIVSINGETLGQPRALSRVDIYIQDSLKIPGSKARWIARDMTKDPEGKLKGAIPFVVRGTITIPPSVDPATVRLTLRYTVDDQLLQIRLNGQPVPLKSPARLKRMRIETESIAGPFVAGQNTIEFEIANGQNDKSQNYVGLIADWQLDGQPTNNPSP